MKTPQADTIQYLALLTWNEEQRPWLWYELIELAMNAIAIERGNDNNVIQSQSAAVERG